jgi:hypothetical protein
MTEDPREFGLTAADLRAAADRLYEPGDDRLDRIGWTHGTQARYGQIRSRLRSLADAIEPDEPAEPEPEDQPEDEPAHRPGLADHRAALAAARAILTGDDQAAHAAAGSGSCPQCTALDGISLGMQLVSTLAGEKLGVSPELARVMLAAVEAAEAELRGMSN